MTDGISGAPVTLSAQLQPVWSAYGIRIETDPSVAGVGHSDAIYLIDAAGARAYSRIADIMADALAGDLKLLSAER